MSKDQRTLGITAMIVTTAVLVHAVCPTPQPAGKCGWASQTDDCSNGCCQITGPGQIDRKTCLGSAGSTDCDNNPSPLSYTIARYECVTVNGTDYCNHSALTPLNCDGSVVNPVFYNIWCNNAVSRTTTKCKTGSGGTP